MFDANYIRDSIISINISINLFRDLKLRQTCLFEIVCDLFLGTTLSHGENIHIWTRMIKIKERSKYDDAVNIYYFISLICTLKEVLANICFASLL